MLYPINTDTRAVLDLSGLWNFRVETKEGEVDPASPMKHTQSVAVPASYNDQLANQSIRDHIGNVWYEKEFYCPSFMRGKRLVLRFGSVTHSAKVYVNGRFATEHRGGFTPFEVEIHPYLKEGKNRITVSVSNIIDYTTLPVGVYSEVEEDGETKRKISENFDFYNYAGIHRPVKIYATDFTYIQDLTVHYDVRGESVEAKVVTQVTGPFEDIRITLFDEEEQCVQAGSGAAAALSIPDARLWKPLDSYLYTLKVDVWSSGWVVDSYSLPIGFRTVAVVDDQFLINGEPFYFKGFGKHEDFYIIGRGLSEPANVMDIQLLKSLGGNSFRTSHYPYSEEMMRLADREGIVVIDETPAVSLYAGFNVQFAKGEEPNTWAEMKTFSDHEQVIKEMIARDKNHACVVMWSVANEPATHQTGAVEYFEPLIRIFRELDGQKRPVTIVFNMEGLPEQELTHPLVDVICLNRYYGWYLQTGDLEAGEKALRAELDQWTEMKVNKPFLFTEYGADTIPGLHSHFHSPFTEEYQVALNEMYHSVFDDYPFIAGEQLWNFADFETKLGTGRVQGNKKGIFTRAREPKMSGYLLKQRWEKIPDFNYRKSERNRGEKHVE